MVTGRSGHHGVTVLSLAERVNVEDFALAATRDLDTTDETVLGRPSRRSSATHTTAQVSSNSITDCRHVEIDRAGRKQVRSSNVQISIRRY